MTYAQIAAKVGVSRQRVHQIVTGALAAATERTGELAGYALERDLLLIEALVREAAKILNTKCETCEGDEKQRASCTRCMRTGYLYPPDTRLEAIDRIGDAQDRRIKLFRLEERGQPAPHPGPPYYEFLQTLSDEELADEVERLEGALAGEG